MQGEASKVQSWLVSFSLGKSLGWSRRDRYRPRAPPALVPSVLVKDQTSSYFSIWLVSSWPRTVLGKRV